jgi:hypothetical protein
VLELGCEGAGAGIGLADARAEDAEGIALGWIEEMGALRIGAVL